MHWQDNNRASLARLDAKNPSSMSTDSQRRFATSPNRKPDVAARMIAPRQSPSAIATSLEVPQSECLPPKASAV